MRRPSRPSGHAGLFNSSDSLRAGSSGARERMIRPIPGDHTGDAADVVGHDRRPAHGCLPSLRPAFPPIGSCCRRRRLRATIPRRRRARDARTSARARAVRGRQSSRSRASARSGPSPTIADACSAGARPRRANASTMCSGCSASTNPPKARDPLPQCHGGRASLEPRRGLSLPRSVRGHPQALDQDLVALRSKNSIPRSAISPRDRDDAACAAHDFGKKPFHGSLAAERGARRLPSRVTTKGIPRSRDNCSAAPAVRDAEVGVGSSSRSSPRTEPETTDQEVAAAREPSSAQSRPKGKARTRGRRTRTPASPSRKAPHVPASTAIGSGGTRRTGATTTTSSNSARWATSSATNGPDPGAAELGKRSTKRERCDLSSRTCSDGRQLRQLRRQAQHGPLPKQACPPCAAR